MGYPPPAEDQHRRGYPMDRGDKIEKKAPPIIIQHSGDATATSLGDASVTSNETDITRNGESSNTVGFYMDMIMIWGEISEAMPSR